MLTNQGKMSILKRKETLLKLGKLKIIDSSFSTSIAKIARLLNILAHQYLDIKWDYIKDFISKKSEDVDKFM
ncbi:HepT-like ribonuclease domain-containing protein [Caldicellulosiruptor acetigenus]|jgi:uncharacterized protein YutE (UPF0331/DUF86 family)|uniref:HepT-like ribonuclease domain-containing protein n=1 Tax=Caldicellulosiruptor acetigenus TaxID=301953 RepID=UPI0001E9908B|nr:HepT-like ribonuclease domain-containing protein [Caldicellulosiruptor acetigenus]